MAIWLTSDTHFDHAFVARTRGFDTPEEHDAHIVREWNMRVQPRDTVWVLGDFGMGTINRFYDTAKQLNGTKHLVTGNHDQCAPGFKQPNREVGDVWLSVFDSIQQYGVLGYKGSRFLLSHYPYEDVHLAKPVEGQTREHERDRHLQWRLRDLGVTLLHGHTHSTEKVSYSPAGTLQLHVGWDTWGKPVPLSTFYALLEKHRYPA